jgi:hypothetical protein
VWQVVTLTRCPLDIYVVGIAGDAHRADLAGLRCSLLSIIETPPPNTPLCCQKGIHELQERDGIRPE